MKYLVPAAMTLVVILLVVVAVSALSSSADYKALAEQKAQEAQEAKEKANKKLPLSKEAKAAAAKWKQVEKESKGKGNISIEIRKGSSDSTYLSMDDLANLVDKPKDANKEAALARDAKEYKPIRDAIAHTALLTDTAKKKLTSVRENIKGRVKEIVGERK